MSDRRTTPSNGRVAALYLQGKVAAERYVAGEPRLVAAPLADLRDAPDGRRERQLLLGEAVTLLEDRAGWAFVQAARDGYVGYLPSAALAADEPAPDHAVCAPATHLYSAPDIKAPERAALSHGCRLHVTGAAGAFAATPQGYVPQVHLRPLARPETDPVAVAMLYLGTPYLWGGNSRWGIDCSGLVQAALTACGLACPGDSDQQAALGRPASGAPRRGDLLFWKGHVAIAVDGETLIHANAHHMAVALEPRAEAVARIAAQGGGAVTAHRRP